MPESSTYRLCGRWGSLRKPVPAGIATELATQLESLLQMMRNGSLENALRHVNKLVEKGVLSREWGETALRAAVEENATAANVVDAIETPARRWVAALQAKMQKDAQGSKPFKPKE